MQFSNLNRQLRLLVENNVSIPYSSGEVERENQIIGNISGEYFFIGLYQYF
jgi:hypothetical protein